MDWSEQVFNYCERALDPSFWAEPVNALTNIAFLAAAVIAGVTLRRRPPDADAVSAGEWLAIWMLIALVAIIGVGSFLFHTFATRWALIADVAPITLFMAAYLAYALRMFLRCGWIVLMLAVPAFLGLGAVVSSLTCARNLATSGLAQAELPPAALPCFNGSLGYAPALAALFVIGAIMICRGLPAGRKVLAAGGVFSVSIVLRTVDRELCNATRFLDHAWGTHALWHVLNAVTLYILLSAAIETHRRRP
ncbi:MAG: ceramidase domain-containing protein [Hyphomicrobiaceae bacterium]